MKRYLLVALAAGVYSQAAAPRPVLLPDVQQISYGSGSVGLCRLQVKAHAPLNDEDRFTIQQVNQWQSEICGAPVHKLQRATLALIREGDGSATPGPADVVGPQSREAYRISSNATGVQLRARSSTGLFYAFQTLRQLVQGRASEAAIPSIEIEDYPSFAYRGFMMDFAHGAVLTEDEVKRQLDFLARWKANQYYFYSETNIDLDGYPLLHSVASWSPESIQRIIAYARERHIDVVPCVELYGHLHDLFRHEQYASLAGLTHGGEINPRDAKAIAITEDWLRQLAALFPSPWFHFGLDEPWELERADPAIAKPERFYLDQLRRLSALAVKLGKRPMFWADVAEGAFIFKKYPELYGQLPHEAIAVPWFYSTLPDFTPLVKPFADNGVSQMIASGVANWEEVSTDFEATFRNIDDFTRAGKKYGALGLINTGWTDSAQAIYREAWPAIAYGSIAGWQSAPIDRERFFSDYAQIEYPLAASDAAAAFAAVAKAQQLLSAAIGSESMFRFWDDPLAPAALARTHAHRNELHECRLAIEEVQLHLAKVQAAYPDSLTLPAVSLAARMIDFAALKFIYAEEMATSFARLPQKPTNEDIDFYLGRQASARNHSRISDLMDECAELRVEYEASWRAEYRPYRLATALGRWNAEFEYWRSLQARIWESVREFERTGTRPDLQKMHGDVR